MRHDKKMDKMLETASKEKLLTPRYHFYKPDMFWKEGYNLFDNNGELIERDTENILVSAIPPKHRKESILMIFWKMWRYTILNPLPTIHSI